MVFYPVPSLQHLAAINVSTLLWNVSDVRNVMKSFRFRSGEKTDKIMKEWNVLEDTVSNKVDLLKLPELLKNNLLNLVKPMGLEVLKWKQFLEQNLDHCFYPPNELFWTLRGMIDKKRIAEVLVKDRNIDINIRYKLACFYCFESHTKTLFIGISDETKNDILCKRPWLFKETEEIPFYYICTASERLIINLSDGFFPVKPLQSLFETAVCKCNRAAAEYFWHKLNHAEMSNSLERVTSDSLDVRYLNSFTCSHEYHSDVIFFMLAIMNEQQTSVFKNMFCNLLKSFLCWPLQDFFLQITNLLWDVLSPDEFLLNLETITEKVIYGYKDYNYLKLFIEFWHQAPETYKRFVIHVCASCMVMLPSLFTAGHPEYILLIFNDATLEEKEKIIYHYEHAHYTTSHNIYSCSEDDFRKYLLFLKDLVHMQRKKQSMTDMP